MHIKVIIAIDRSVPDISQVIPMLRCRRMVVTANNPKSINAQVAGSGAAIGGVGVMGVVPGGSGISGYEGVWGTTNVPGGPEADEPAPSGPAGPPGAASAKPGSLATSGRLRTLASTRSCGLDLVKSNAPERSPGERSPRTPSGFFAASALLTAIRLCSAMATEKRQANKSASAAVRFRIVRRLLRYRRIR